MHPQLFCSVIEAIANQALTMSESSKAQLEKLGEASLLVQISELGFPLLFRQCQQRLLITSATEQAVTADCSIYTSFSTLAELKSEHQLTELIKQEKLDIQGDLKVAKQFAAIAESIDIDWGSELEKHVGDIAAFKIMSLAKKAVEKAKFVKTQISSDATEYLVHEQKLMVTQPELTRFFDGVSACTSQTNQIEQQVKQLQQRLANLNS